MKEINDILTKLEEAIRKGDDQQAAELAIQAVETGASPLQILQDNQQS